MDSLASPFQVADSVIRRDSLNCRNVEMNNAQEALKNSAAEFLRMAFTIRGTTPGLMSSNLATCTVIARLLKQPEYKS